MKRASLKRFWLASEPLFRFSIFRPLRIDTKRYYECAQCTDVDPACKLSKRSILRSILKTDGLLLSEYGKVLCHIGAVVRWGSDSGGESDFVRIVDNAQYGLIQTLQYLFSILNDRCIELMSVHCSRILATGLCQCA